MDPKKWGRNMWQSLLNIALVYPDNPTDNIKEKYSIFLNALSDVLPCDNCKKNFKQHLYEIPPNLESKTEFLNWLCLVYNLTRTDQNRDGVSFDYFFDYFNNFEKNHLIVSWNVVIGVVLVFLVIVLSMGYILHKKYDFFSSLWKG